MDKKLRYYTILCITFWILGMGITYLGWETYAKSNDTMSYLWRIAGLGSCFLFFYSYIKTIDVKSEARILEILGYPKKSKKIYEKPKRYLQESEEIINIEFYDDLDYEHKLKKH